MHQAIGESTWLIDCLLQRPQMAACYLVRDQDELAIIDCGTLHSVPHIMQAIDAIGGHPEQVRWIMPTHVHLDHAGGAGRLMQVCGNATLVTHPRGMPHMIDPTRLQAGAIAVYGEQAFTRDFGELFAIEPDRTIAADDGQAFTLGTRRLEYLHTPGHANHHGCVFDKSNGYLFTGDTFGLAYPEFGRNPPYLIATTTPVAFDPDAWRSTLQRLMKLTPSVACLTHFGPLDEPAEHVERLQRSLDEHVEIALAEEHHDDDGKREQRLFDALDRLLVDAAVGQTGVTGAQARMLLLGDIRLNAQGLAVWLTRRARKGQSA